MNTALVTDGEKDVYKRQGSGKSFIAGADISEMYEKDEMSIMPWAALACDLCMRIETVSYTHLAYVMTCSSARQQRHVHRYVCPRELFAHESRHVVHASDVPHRIERSYLAAYPHEFEYIAPGPEFLQSFICLLYTSRCV